MFESRETAFEAPTIARFGGDAGPAACELLERSRLTDPPAIPLTPLALREEFPRLRVASGTWAPARTQPAPSPTWSATRWRDVILACAVLLFFAPLMAVIACAISLTSRGPILFRQQRLGLGGRTFVCLKFRTMRQDSAELLAELLARDRFARGEWERTHKLRDDPRTSRFGAFLRKTSLDELPQFFNVLAGQMSIVGPRPIVQEEAYLYRKYISSYYAVKPGITGLWQISGRNHTTYRRRVACDVRYVRSRNAYRDLAIIALTVPTVLLGRGAY